MYKWNDIVILGDSFCGARSVPNHWPYRLSNLITGEDPGPKVPARGYGWGGASWWSVKRQLPFYLDKKPKILVICHTEPMRIPSNLNKPLNISSIESGTHSTADDDIFNSARLYYQHLFIEEFHLWAQQQWFKELDNILDQCSSLEQVYHLHCFHGEWNNYPFKRGVRFLDNLWHYSQPNDEHANHLTSADNHRLAQQLAALIENYPGDGHVVSKFNLKDKR